MLYWLATQRPDASRPLWELFDIDPPVGSPDPAMVRREWRHIDLYVDSGMPGRKLVLENKISAIATGEQLERYHADLEVHAHVPPDVTRWRLLTLLRPTFTLPEPWELVDYSQLVAPMRATADALTGRDRGLVGGYADLVQQLVSLRDVFDPNSDLDRPMFLTESTRAALQEARLLALVLKMQVSRCAELLTRELAATTSQSAGAGLTNAQGLVEWFTPATRGRQFGWQVQGRQFRFVGVTGRRDPKPRPAREALMEAQHSDYFAVGLPAEHATVLEPYTGSKTWLGYEPDFVYQYQLLAPTTTWRQLLELALWASVRAHDYAESSRR